ncbi:MAG: alpha/beta hydrolase [Eubacteriales bacterium]
MKVVRLILIILMWILIIGFLTNQIMRTISYSFYKGKRKMDKVSITPEKLSYNEKLTGYGYNLTNESNSIILCFGGSLYIAYNTVGTFAANYNVPFLSVDYYGTQDSKGKMNLSSMQESAETLYDWANERYPNRKIIIIGHSYGCGMAAYLASVRPCSHLFLLSGFRDLAELYNQIVPFFRGPFKIFISDNINVSEYAKKTTCPVTVIGSDADKTLKSDIQIKLADCYETNDLEIFPDIEHEYYLTDERVISLIQKSLD